MKKFLKEFKEFAVKGNMFDMAIGVIMGGAVTKVITSIVTDLMNPLIGLVVGKGANLADLKFTVNGVDFTYGVFLNNLLDFLLITLMIFLMVKGINKMRNLKKDEEVKEAPIEPEISSTDKLLTEILEELKKQK